MTPKEKAEDLINSFRMVLMNEDTECGNELLCTSIAIKNTLISVNEIINDLKSVYCSGESDITDVINYWEEVKKELEKQ